MRWIVLFLALAPTAYAEDQIPDTDMHAMTREVLVLQKYLFSPAEFGAGGNEKAIGDSLTVLGKHLGRLETKVFAGQPALRTNVALLRRQVADADRSFRAGDKALARYELVSSLQLCVACHTRTASADIVLQDSELKGASPREKADFSFATRQFETGRKAYEDILANEGARLSPAEFRSTALPLVIYYARVKEDPAGGKAWAEALAKTPGLGRAQRERAREWAREFATWARTKAPEAYNFSETELLEKARELLKGKPGEIARLRASSYLHSVLEVPGEKSPAKAEALLELGRIYSALDYQLFFRFGELYLKTCIEDYPKSKSAKACYASLDRSVKKRAGGGGAEEVDLLQWKRMAE